MATEKSSKNKSVLAAWGGLGLQERMMVVMTIGMIVSSFFLGYFYGQLRILKGGAVLGNNEAPTGEGNNAPTADAPEPAQPLTEALWKEILADPVAEMGPKDAKVTMVEFTDFQCPFCKRHFDETAGQIEANYIKPGKIRYVARDLPLSFHPNAHIAAEAARCAGDQNKYWEMHDKLFTMQDSWVNGDPKAQFSSYAKELGMNVSTFDSCVASGKHKAAVDADLALATKVGASGTPTFFINGKMIVGAQPYSAFESAIEGAL